MEDPSTYRGGLNIADSVAMRLLRQVVERFQIMEQRAYAYAALIEDCERVVDEVGGAEVTLRGLHACGSLRPT